MTSFLHSTSNMKWTHPHPQTFGLEKHSQPCCCLESGFGVVYMTAIQVIFNSEGQKFIQCKPK